MNQGNTQTSFLSPSSRRIIVAINLFVLISGLTIFFIWFNEGEKATALPVGQGSKVKGSISVPLFQTSALSGLTRKEILNLRSAAVMQNPLLLSTDYHPYSKVFENMEDYLPWFGVKGFYLIGPSENSTEGHSMESKYILNPFLLVGAEFWGITIWAENKIKWNESLLTDEALSNPDFPFYCRPYGLTWWPEENRAEVTYPLSTHIQELNKYLTVPVKETQSNFALVAINARDFGYKFISVDMSKSNNIEAPKAADTIVKITDKLRNRSSFCGSAGGCNSMGPAMPALNSIIIKALPARISVKLWKKSPLKHIQDADLFYDIIIN